ncbi:MAG: VOC family protein [Rickettsiales bacterium]|nr:VOC family protein [Rickettsiales bacterium]
MDKIHHIAIQVPNISEGVDWYVDNFKTNILYQDESWAFLEFANINLALVLPNQHPPHIAFETDDATKYGTLTPHRDGTASIYIDDPFGNKIEMLQDNNKKHKHNE